MPKKVKLEDRFIKTLSDNKIDYSSKILCAGDKLYLPDFVFDGLIVEVSEELTPKKLEVIGKFRKANSGYKVYLLSEDAKHAIEFAELFDEVFDYGSINVLMSQIKKCKGLR